LFIRKIIANLVTNNIRSNNIRRIFPRNNKNNWQKITANIIEILEYEYELIEDEDLIERNESNDNLYKEVIT